MEKYQSVVFLIRHGETDYDYSTVRDVDGQRILTKIGYEKAEKVGKYLSAFQLACIYTSPLRRTVQTAESLAKGYGQEIEIRLEKKLQEIYPSEPSGQATKRPVEAVLTLTNNHQGETLALVTHQYVIGTVIGYMEGVNDWRLIDAPNCIVYRLVLIDQKIVFWQKLNLFD